MVASIPTSSSLPEAAPELQNRIDSVAKPDEARPSNALEVDFENRTPLYDALLHSQWDSIALFLYTGYWESYHFFPDRLAPSDQVRTWVVKQTDASTKKRLPIHAAVALQAPFPIVQRLVSIYPVSLFTASAYSAVFYEF